MESIIPDESKPAKYPILDEIEVPEDVLENWQVTADLLANVANVSAALIMRVHAHDIEVFVASHGIENTHPRGEKAPLDTGLYCETVMSTQRKLLVPNALEDPAWDHNPDIALGMISYCGLPLTWPTGKLFGTLCILDNKSNAFGGRTQPIMERLRDSIQLSLANLYETSLARMERNIAERDKQANEERLKAFYELSLVGLAITSPEKGWVRINDCLCKMLEYSEQELRETTWAQLTHQDDLAIDVEQFNRLLANEIDGYSLEKRFVSRSGKIVYTNLVVRCVRKTNGEVDYVVAMVEDITERKHVEAELERHRHHLEDLVTARTADLAQANTALEAEITQHKQTEDKLDAFNRSFEAFLDQATDFIYFKDIHSRFIFCSQTLAAITGHKHWRDMIGKHDREVFPPDTAKIYEEEEVPVFSEGRPLLNKTNPYYDAAGHLGYVQTNKWPLFDAAGRIVGIFGISRDITERLAADKALKEAKQAAETANIAKSAFLANMSHEFRTPMNHIIGMTTMALRRATDPKQRDQLEKVSAASQHLLGLINDILDLSKIEAFCLNLEHINFTLGEITGNLANIVGHRASDKGLQFFMEVPETLASQALQGDPLRLSQILINLVGNAVKFTKSGHVAVRVRVVEECSTKMLLRFEVEDTGIGVSADEQKRLFLAFKQANSSITRKYGGTGLGLALSKRLIELMGGEIGVISEPGNGSTFWFSVRLEKGSAVTPEPTPIIELSAKEQLQARHGNARILVVEDEPINMMVAQDMLEQVGLHSDPAIDGYEAAVLAQDYPYDLILMDMQMPVLNGLDATRIIRADSLNKETPIVAMTANAFEEDRRICFDAGMNDHVSKPVLPAKLYEAMLLWLDKRISMGPRKQQLPEQTQKNMAMNFDDAIAAHIRWKIRLRRFVEGCSTENIESGTTCRDDLCELGKWIYGDGAKYADLTKYQDLVSKHANFHLCAGDVVKMVERNDRAGAITALGGHFTDVSKETMKAIMDLKQEATKD